MKKLSLMLLIITLTINPLTIYADQKTTVKVSLPSFNVKLNGKLFDSKNNAYPLIVYNNITYVPMTYNYARFLGLKTIWYEQTKYNYPLLFVGASGEKTTDLTIYPTEKANNTATDAYTATIADYAVAINTVNKNKFIDNTNSYHPILNFRNVTYFPLTYDFAWEQLGWQYQWTAEKGLEIDSSQAFRPVIEETDCLKADSKEECKYDYCSNNYCYIKYPLILNAENSDIVVGKRNGDVKKYNLKEQLSAYDIYRFNWFEVDEDWFEIDEVRAYTPPFVSTHEGESIFCISVKRQLNKDTEAELVELCINLDNGKVIFEDSEYNKR